MNAGTWKPQGRAGWTLTAGAGLFTTALSVLAVSMAAPIRWDGLGILGALALFFPLHLFLVVAVTAALGLLAWRLGQWLALVGFGLASVLAALLALIPTLAILQRAGELNVPISLGTYLSNGLRFNSGPVRTDLSVRYGPGPLVLDVWPSGRPDSGPLRPAILLVHGGAWIHGHRSSMPDWNRWLNGLGYEVFDVEYRMPPPPRWQDEVGDVKAALGWVAAHAADYHVDPTRISLMGGSAGANLSLLAAYSAGHPQLPPSTGVPSVRVRCVINLYGPSDMTRGYHAEYSPEFVRPAMEQYIGGPPEAFPDRYRLLSPLSHLGRKSPPTITILGTSDRLVPTVQAELLDRGLMQFGIAHELILLPANDHGFDVNWGGFGTQIARTKIREFLERYDGRP